jgi:hypothetical protein
MSNFKRECRAGAQLRISRWGVLAVLIWFAGAVASYAAPLRFDLPAQPAAAALATFARVADADVLFSADDLKGVRSSEVIGTFEPEDAIARLLRGTGFVARKSGAARFVVIREPRSARAATVRGWVVARSDGQPIGAAQVLVLGTTLSTRTSPAGTFALERVPVDATDVVVQAEGFTPLRITGVSFRENGRAELGLIKLVRAGDGPAHLEEVVVTASELAGLSAAPVLALQRVVVTPSRFGVQEERGGAAATLTETDLLALPQLGDDLYRAISRLPGLAADDVTARFWVRGAPHDQLLARLDGVDLIEPFHVKDTDGSLSIVDIDTISRLDLYTGGFTAEFGDRLAGVLTMETDRHVRPRARTTVGLSLTGGRLASRGQTRDGRGRWLASVRSGFPDMALEAQNTGNGGEVRPRYHDAMGKWEQQVRPNHLVSVHALHARDRMFFQDSDGPLLRSRYGSDYLWARWQAEFGAVTGETVVSRTEVDWHRDGSGLIDVRYPLRVRDERALALTGLRQDWAGAVNDRMLFRAGFEVTRGEADYDYENARDQLVIRGGNFVVDPLSRTVRRAASGTSASGYVTGRFAVAAGLTVEPGLRYDRNSHAGDSDLSPRLNVAWQRGRTTLRAAWGHYRQVHALHRLAVQDGEREFGRAERAEHRVLSLEHRLRGGVNLRLEGYQRIVANPRPHWENVVDSLDAISETEADRLRLDPKRMGASGLELIAEQRGRGRFSWSASYAYARSEETLQSGLTIPRSRDQRHTFYADATWSPNARWQVSLAWQYHTGWPVSEIAFARVPLASGGFATTSTIGSLYNLRLPAYQRLDARVQRRFELKRGVVRVYLDVFNALDRENVIDYAYRLETRPDGVLVTTRVKGDTLFPFLPSVGVVWDF